MVVFHRMYSIAQSLRRLCIMGGHRLADILCFVRLQCCRGISYEEWLEIIKGIKACDCEGG